MCKDRSGILAGMTLSIALMSSAANAIQPDKVLHMKAGAGIAAAVSVVTEDHLLSAAMACAAGTAKEIYDTTGRGTPEMADMFYTCATGTLSAYYLHGATIGLHDDAFVIDISLKW